LSRVLSNRSARRPYQSDFAPFGIANIDGFIYVTYAKQKPPDDADDLSGPGNGFINVISLPGWLTKNMGSSGLFDRQKREMTTSSWQK
jgi:hypothetical protein